ncbi:MAG: nitroreductase family protein [Myxococcales bacterium]|jgi:nitroreductase
MQTTRPIADLIRARTSWRAYLSEPIEESKKQRLREEMSSVVAEVPFGTRLRFELIELPELDPKALRALGTYGFIKGARSFLAGTAGEGERRFEDYGFALESLILLATDLGLGTCWLGGSFSNSAFASQLGAGPGEMVPAVSPIGYATDQRAMRDRVIRLVAGSKSRKPWEELFFSEELGRPLAPAEAGPYAEVLELVRLAPSASNKQPWRIVRARGGEAFHLLLERTLGYNEGFLRFGKADLQRLDMGIALCHFERAAREAGLPGRWSTEEPGLSLPAGIAHVATWSPAR